MVLKITAGLFAQNLQAACNIQDIILNLKGQADTGADFQQPGRFRLLEIRVNSGSSGSRRIGSCSRAA